jgi:ketosteroid isomerase-like protein
MRTLPLAALALAAACAHTPAPMPDPATLAAAETAFAAHSVREDMRAAFLAHFRADGVVARDGWIVSNDFLRTRPAPPIVLDWRPAFVEVAGSGEIGLSTGPWKITSKQKADAPPTFGQYVSIWKREGDGPWQVAVDIGIEHPGAALAGAPLAARLASPGPRAAESLDAAEARFAAEAARGGLAAAHEAHGSADLRFYRPGHAPAVGKADALALARALDRRYAWTAEKVEAAASGDFGYARGRYAAPEQPGEALGYWMRAWHVEDGRWRVLLEVTAEAPKRPAAAG